MKIKVTIMTNKSYPDWIIKNQVVEVDENERSYYWVFKRLEELYKSCDDEYPAQIAYQIL